MNEININLYRDLPFFSYGCFRPGEISFLGIKDFVSDVRPFSIPGDLVLRDGLTLYKDSNEMKVNGYLISFDKSKQEEAYSFIDSLEPKKLFRWEMKCVDGLYFNILYGVKPNKGSDDIREANWNSMWEDPFFTAGIEVLREFKVEPFEWSLKPLFKLQMKYMLLWTILERFTFLRYSIGGGPSERNSKLSNNQYFKEALGLYLKKERIIFNASDPDEKITLTNSDPKSAIKYYYQVRCNITHRGKAVTRDHDIVDKSFSELFKITEYVLKKTKYECETIRTKYIE
jgi:hypothetical protein